MRIPTKNLLSHYISCLYSKKTVRNKQSADYILIISAFINEPLARLELATYALRISAPFLYFLNYNPLCFSLLSRINLLSYKS